MSVIRAGNTTTTGFVVSSDTTGNLVFTTGGSNATALTLSNTQAATFAGTLSTASKGITAASLPAGSVLQVSQAIFTGIQTITASGDFNWTDVSSLSVTITPTSSSSKMLLIAQVSCAVLTVNRIVGLRFTGGNSGTFVGDAAGSRTRTATFFTSPSATGIYPINAALNISYLDSPATASAITYKVQAAPNSGTGNVAINYNSGDDTNFSYIPRAASSLIVMEIAA